MGKILSSLIVITFVAKSIKNGKKSLIVNINNEKC